MSAPARRTRRERNIFEHATADGRKILEVGFRDSGGVQRWRTVEGGISAARVVRDEILSRRARGERVKPNPRIHFGEAADRWWEARVVKLRPATQAAYGLSLKHLRIRFERTQLDELSVNLVADFISDMERRGYAGWTIKGALTVVGSVFDYAARHLDWHGSNPVRQLERGERPKVEERDKRVLGADELDRLLTAVDSEHRLIFHFAAATGARLGEVLGVRWHGIDFDLGLASFSHQLDRRGEYVSLKTKRSRRTIEVPTTLLAELREHRLRTRFSGDHDYVFASRTGRGHDHRNIAGRVLARAVTRAGLEAELCGGKVVKPAPTMHSLRHSHGSALIAAGWDIEEVSARLGHRDTVTTARAYVHAYESSRRSAARAARLEAMYGSAVEASVGREAQQTATAGTRKARRRASKPLSEVAG